MAIERGRILEEALALLDEAGLEGLTTRKLAERLGVQQPALYWHFRSKPALLDALGELLLERFHSRRLPEPDEEWDAFTLAHARSFRRALLKVRDGARLHAGTRPSVHRFADAERQLELYVKAGFPAEQALAISLGVMRYVTGFVIEEQDERARQDSEADGAALAAMQPFPILTEALTPLFAGGAMHTDAMFEAGLAFMLAGIRNSLKKPRRKRDAEKPETEQPA